MRKSSSSMLKLLALLLALCAGAAAGQTYPTKTVRIIVPFAPGGVTDIAARIVAQKLTERVGQSFIVDNRVGATGIIGSEFVAKSAPDGYTLLVGSQTVMAVVPVIYTKLVTYNTTRDFIPVILLANSPTLIAVNPSLPVKSIKELIAFAKARPGELTFGAGSGATGHLFGEMFKQIAHVNLMFVPYQKGGEAQANNEAMSGQISMVFSNFSSVWPLVQAGKLRGLAVTSAQRVPSAPNIPTVAEAGLPAYTSNSWLGLYAPAGTAREIVVKLNRDVAGVLNSPDVKNRMAELALFADANTPEQFSEFLKTEIPRWQKVVKDAGIKPQ